MTVPSKYSDIYLPVKYFLTSYRALSDGRAGIRHLDQFVRSPSTFLASEWKVIWIGTCTLLRTSIDVFRVDAKSCINERIRDEILSEWNRIRSDRDEHSIFWEFLRKERDNVLHQYEWSAYEMWMDRDGNTRPRQLSMLALKPEEVESALVMTDGPYKDRNSLDLLNEAADWVETRIFSAIRRAGFDPEENRNSVSFEKPRMSDIANTLIGGAIAPNEPTE